MSQDREVLYLFLGARVREIREGLGMTQLELAEKVGIERTSIANLEAGKQNMPVDRMYRIAAALGVPIAVLLPPERPEMLKPISELFREFLRTTFGANDADR